jgi:hypothetical protein
MNAAGVPVEPITTTCQNTVSAFDKESREFQNDILSLAVMECFEKAENVDEASGSSEGSGSTHADQGWTWTELQPPTHPILIDYNSEVHEGKTISQQQGQQPSCSAGHDVSSALPTICFSRDEMNSSDQVSQIPDHPCPSFLLDAEYINNTDNNEDDDNYWSRRRYSQKIAERILRSLDCEQRRTSADEVARILSEAETLPTTAFMSMDQHQGNDNVGLWEDEADDGSTDDQESSCSSSGGSSFVDYCDVTSTTSSQPQVQKSHHDIRLRNLVSGITFRFTRLRSKFLQLEFNEAINLCFYNQ